MGLASLWPYPHDCARRASARDCGKGDARGVDVPAVVAAGDELHAPPVAVAVGVARRLHANTVRLGVAEQVVEAIPDHVAIVHRTAAGVDDDVRPGRVVLFQEGEQGRTRRRDVASRVTILPASVALLCPGEVCQACIDGILFLVFGRRLDRTHTGGKHKYQTNCQYFFHSFLSPYLSSKDVSTHTCKVQGRASAPCP
ncbi:MAG: hypothetical protein ACYTBZ_26130 [Planctomycetota bacterium]